jgi:hypothetical protein
MCTRTCDQAGSATDLLQAVEQIEAERPRTHTILRRDISEELREGLDVSVAVGPAMQSHTQLFQLLHVKALSLHL